MIKNIIKFFVFSFLISSMVGAQELLRIGDAAPDFKLPYATRDTIDFNGISLSSLLDKSNIILAFYPADWSGGCTKELCSLRDNFKKLSDLNAVVLGISGDYVFSHREWAKYHNLPFKLLSDHDHEVAKKYKSFNEKNGFNKRTIFLIDKNLKISFMDMDFKVNDDQSFLKLKSELEKLK